MEGICFGDCYKTLSCDEMYLVTYNNGGRIACAEAVLNGCPDGL